ncbi:nucleotidyl transferase AbiEii/AbiGii toxin family protein [Rhodanobacter sp. AS-Z3]|uniref:nucleotidyl transferase AbiEii/AbiGii toxin family protein n=1 Tax=Rhodanobacter sp. AS-Z3 TaxID=3031330 RepID=UPI0024787D41|nr:nucleotidyl transferase AbiEii/AbiGii toxin family protein [Rhodanobacter sp. AS-Z3]WEN16346.1 nucleotidyl transferase AbiEii/AbiGii toxin family protein [Rhodanobacter sp. AS-Z3]
MAKADGHASNASRGATRLNQNPLDHTLPRGADTVRRAYLHTTAPPSPRAMPTLALGIPVLARDDMYAEKLLTHAARALDRSQMSRDLTDLAEMIRAWGPIPATTLEKAGAFYSRAIVDYLNVAWCCCAKTDTAMNL